jgi:hypothetical protein
MNGYFVSCDICGAAGHKAKDCALNRLESRKDPFGEEARRLGYRRKRDLRAAPITRFENAQSS